MPFIPVTRSGQTTYVNSEQIIRISSDGAGSSILSSDGNFIHVSESPAQVVNMIQPQL